MWALVFDDLLEQFINTLVEITGFADDAMLLITGDNLDQMYNLMNRAIMVAHEWATMNGLKLSPEKNYCSNIYEENE